MLHRFPRLVWLVLLIGLIGTSYSTNSSAQGPVIDPAVTKALQTADQVSVIVQLQEPLPLDAPLSARMREIAKRQQSVLAILRSSEFQLVYRYKTVAGFAGKIKKKTALEKLNLHPYVVQIQPDLPVHAIQVQDYRISPSLTQSVPLINANQVHNMGITGAGVRVAVLDTGIDTDHPDLSDDLVAQNCFLDGAGGGCPPPPNVAEDDQGHGTNVSGIITSRGTIAPKGVAPDAKIVAVKVLNAVGSGSFSDVVAAIDWINANNGTLRVKAISMSLGGGLFSGFCDSSFPTMANAINTARNLGITTFAAAGNDGNKSQMSSPGCIQNSVSVGAVYDSNIGGPIFWGVCVDVTTAADQVTCFSNSNETLDILAPGSIITSTGNTGGTSSMSGTSQATPHGSALAALLLQANNALTPAQIESAIKNNGKAVTDPGNNLTRPRIDALAAVNAVLPPVVDIQRPTGASPQLLKQGDSFQVVFSTNKPGNFAIKVNGTTVATGSAASSSNTVNVTLPNPFAEGVYALKVEVTAEFTGADTENGAVRVDNTPPTDPSNVHSTSHTIGPSAAVRITATSNDNTIDMAWNPDATDPVSNGVSSGVDGFSVAFRNGSTPFCDRTKDLEATAISFTSAPLADGTWFFHLCTVDKVGNHAPIRQTG
ncbi:S8 family serine peptidase [Candidatus Acetothermia bacterium]|nr:S8 family serine peptidase [Candidatus Acetothermia bacterium]